MDDDKKRRYSILINDIYRVINNIDNNKEKINIIPGKISEGLTINNHTYEESNLSSIVSNMDTCKNSLYRIIRELKKSIDE